MWSRALSFCCQSGGFDIATLLIIRRLSRHAKCAADKVLGIKLSSKRGAPAFRGTHCSMAGEPVQTSHLLRRLCGALGRPPAQFTLSYGMEIDCRRRFRSLTALQLSSLVELCNIGVRVGITIRVVGGDRGGVGHKWQSQIASMRADISLPSLTELYLSGKETATQNVMEWFLRCGMPQLNLLTYIAFPWRKLLRASYYAPILINKFGSLPMLTSLSLAQNALWRRPIQLLKALTCLTELDISANPLYPDEIHDLASVLHSLTRLVDLNMSSDYLLDNGLAVVAPAIPKSVTRLDLSSNELGINGGESLAGLLLPLPSLTWLNLSSNASGVGLLQLSSLTNLTMLDLSNNGLDTAGPMGV